MSEVLKLLEKWSDYPSYSLERRLDVFIGVYLSEILKEVFDEDFDVKNIFPEVPYRIVSKAKKPSSHIDFICISKDKTPFFVEVKTDAQSIDREQKRNYLYMSSKTLHKIKWDLQDVVNSKRAGKHIEKYKKLISDLKGVGDKTTKIRVVYISPKTDVLKKSSEKREIDLIDYRKVCDVLNKTKLEPELAIDLSAFIRRKKYFEK